MRKFLVVLDNTTECLNAMRFAALRASHTGGGVTILAVIPPEEFNHWIGVADIMREEARERIEAHFDIFSKRMQENEGVTPDLVIREGKPEVEIIDYIQDTPEVGVLVLGAGTGKEGPGPLVTYVLRNAGSLPIPVTIVPGGMSKEAIVAVA
jgi:nucleotide-binding universal stress UspA family protein